MSTTPTAPPILSIKRTRSAPAMKLTKENLHAIATRNGAGWNKKQLRLLGVKWPPRGGWLTRLAGSEIADADYQELLQLRGQVSVATIAIRLRREQKAQRTRDRQQRKQERQQREQQREETCRRHVDDLDSDCRRAIAADERS